MDITSPQPETPRNGLAERSPAKASRDDILSFVLEFTLPGDFSAERLIDRFDTRETRQ